MPEVTPDSIESRIAQQLNLPKASVEAAVALLDEGATVPFLARYRKEVTGGLTDTQLRHLQERLAYLRELEERRRAVLAALADAGQLNSSLEQALLRVDTKAELEELYVPYKARRRTKAQLAMAAGLEPLADRLLRSQSSPRQEVRQWLGSDDEQRFANALQGAADILVERLCQRAEIVTGLRQVFWSEGVLQTRLVKGKEPGASTYRDYFDYQEPIRRVASHRALAVLRAAKAGVLRIRVVSGDDDRAWISRVSRHSGFPKSGPTAGWMQDVVQQAWKTRLRPAAEKQVLQRLRERAETEAVAVFSKNLESLLMAAPAGARITLGLDPGLRTGVKAAVVDATGRLLATDTFYPHSSKQQWHASQVMLATLCQRHQVDLIALGNGTGSEETDRWLSVMLDAHPQIRLTRVLVSEAGASVYSASELAAREFPDLDVTLRGAVSIARRLQDPLAELVKIEPRSIGVGQYQHDLDRKRLDGALDGVTETCVNQVGVDLNTASPALLSRVAGFTPTLAGRVVAYRDARGAFRRREQLLDVPRFGPKVYEQAAGFLRIREPQNPLDNTAVHPESYGLVASMADRVDATIVELIGNRSLLERAATSLGSIRPEKTFTLSDIVDELMKPGRDPRPEFRTAAFDSKLSKPADLRPGMCLEGVVTNVTAFGAFIDLGVHQDGLVHLSQLADRYVKDPHTVVQVGQVVKVRVLTVDLQRNRIGLSMKAE